MGGSAGEVALQVALVVVIAAAALTAAFTGGPPWHGRRAPVALAVVALATAAGATLGSSQWLPTWVLLANALPTALHGRRLAGGVVATAAASAIEGAIADPRAYL